MVRWNIALSDTLRVYSGCGKLEYFSHVYLCCCMACIVLTICYYCHR